MSANIGIVFELFLSAGCALGFGFWQLYSLKRERLRREQRRAAEAATRAEPGIVAPVDSRTADPGDSRAGV